jgi:predicted phage tail protein
MVIKLANGEVQYITKTEDFKEVVEIAIYEALEEFVESELDKAVDEVNEEKDSYADELDERVNQLEGESEEKDNIIDKLEDSNEENISMLKITDQEVKDLLDYVQYSSKNIEPEELLEYLADRLKYIRYEVLSDI